MVKRAAAHLKGQQTKRDKKKGPTAREKEIEWKLREGLMRQEAVEKMGDWESEEEDDGEEEDEKDVPVRLAPTAHRRCRPIVIEDNEDEE